MRELVAVQTLKKHAVRHFLQNETDGVQRVNVHLEINIQPNQRKQKSESKKNLGRSVPIAKHHHAVPDSVSLRLVS